MKVILTIFVVLSVAYCGLPPYLKICSNKDPNLNKCIIDSIDHIRPKLVTGIPELNVPSMEPLILKSIQIRSGPSQAKIDVDLTNLKVWGPSTMKITDLKANIRQHHFKSIGIIPSIYFEGDYVLDMNVLILKYKGKGLMKGNITDYTFNCDMKGDVFKKGGEDYLRFRRFKIDLKTGPSFLHLGDLDFKDPAIANGVNDVVRENSDLILEQTTPELAKALEEALTEISNRIVESAPYRELFPEKLFLLPPGIGAASTIPAWAAAAIWLPSGPKRTPSAAGPFIRAPGLPGPTKYRDACLFRQPPNRRQSKEFANMNASWLVSFSGVVVIVIVVLPSIDAIIPSYIKVCRKSDPNIGKCIIESIDKLRPKLRDGIPELKVPSIEPLPLDEIKLRSGPNQAKIDANITNVKVWGPSHFQIIDLKPNLAKNKFVVRVTLPNLYFEGDYDIDMNVLILKYQGRGPITGNFTDYNFDCIMKGDIVKKDGKQHLHFRKFGLKLSIGKSHLHLGNLFSDDAVLGRATNEVVRDNADLFVNEIKPVLENSLAQKFTDIANSITSTFAYEELFPTT
ncbi:uncharacterized protein LOC132697137 [Cylas formicarius]|uniref:uncharacterized protein LOC132697137 n=1 Tax=Cylas formicarius TaxID=197179 RepID=UPI0029586EA8|nr:uncharacterized protein LOC132697137 [Cylas formicarius]